MKKLIFLITFLMSLTLVYGQSQYIGLYNTANPMSCSMCHTETIASWESTGHAIAQDSVSNPYYGYDCLSCHNTGWDPNTANGGADEFVSQDTTQTPDYVITDQTKWDNMKNVQCEQCHGPVGDASGALDMTHTGRDTDFSAENCGICHQDSHHPYLEEWSESAHSESEVVFFTRENNGDCYYCHYAQDFVAFVTDDEYDGSTFVPEGDVDNVITCSACHNPHGNDNPGNIRDLPPAFDGKIVCDVCHNSHTDVVDVTQTPHHTTSEVLDGSPLFGYQYPGEEYSNSYHSNIQERCISCHVHMVPYDGEITKTGHTFEPSQESCKECHGDFDLAEGDFDYRGVQSAITGLMETLAANLDAASSEDSTTQEFLQANFNYKSIDAEGSYGIHNTKLVEKLLEDAIASFIPTDVELGQGLPTKYLLSQNYPNPFNPSTAISFALPQAGNVKLTVYDAVGKEVATLVNKNMSAGNYKVNWNAGSMASGIYFYRLLTDNFVQTNKMILLK